MCLCVCGNGSGIPGSTIVCVHVCMWETVVDKPVLAPQVHPDGRQNLAMT